MPIYDIFSKRLRRESQDTPDVFKYEEIPQELRVQVVHILRDSLGLWNQYDGDAPSNQVYLGIHETLSREYGVFRLSPDSDNPVSGIFDFFLNVDEYEKCLDVIEVAFSEIQNPYWEFKLRNVSKLKPEEAVAELNQRFLEHGIGYQFEAGGIIRVDSKFLHSEFTKPVLKILSEERFSSANEEFRDAHEHYREGRYRECIVDCNSSFESVLKVICTGRKWAHSDKDTASRLIGICVDNELIPVSLTSLFGSLRSTLESGVPTLRNRYGGHGQGTEQIEVPPYLAKYVLGMTATAIQFLVDADQGTS